MSDEQHLLPFLPCTADAIGGEWTAPETLGPVRIAYVREGLSLDAFIAYAETYDFGPTAPSQLILHNTANPAASWAPSPGVPNWDADEAGLTEAEIKAKRQQQVDNIFIGYYQDRLGWPAGPHLVVDDRYIWLGTPMNTVGIHANSGNSYRVNGKFRYSVGVEIVGRYKDQRWPSVIIRMLRGALGALARILDIQIVYATTPIGQPARHDRQIAFHRDYTTQKDCPGAAIDPAWAVQVLAQPETPPPPPPPPTAAPYRARAPMWISETPTPRGPIALDGAAIVQAGEIVLIDEVRSDGYVHLDSAVGFLPIGGLERV